MTHSAHIAQLHDVPAVQERLCVGRSKVFALIRSGALRSVQIGARRLVPEQAIIDFISELDNDGASAQR